ncbi:MAG: DNA mismatch repair protein MutS, partial [Deltaproteobacteria bacterium]|nr:DNA mismatch repair protein MutS [Deltaproteobacteria bacterium]
DGLALAWSVVENLIRRAGGGLRTLFATHYHELTALESTTPGLHNMNIAVQEWNNEIVFLRRLVPGPTDRSYGIEVARLAGVPSSVVQRAREILHQLEQTKHPTTAAPPSTLSLLPGFSRPEPPAPKPAPVKQPLHPLLTTLRDLNPDDITPLTALKLVCEWKTLWGNNREPS